MALNYTLLFSCCRPCFTTITYKSRFSYTLVLLNIFIWCFKILRIFQFRPWPFLLIVKPWCCLHFILLYKLQQSYQLEYSPDVSFIHLSFNVSKFCNILFNALRSTSLIISFLFFIHLYSMMNWWPPDIEIHLCKSLYKFTVLTQTLFCGCYLIESNKYFALLNTSSRYIRIISGINSDI